jgi:S1-C subfamily serine protease
MAPRRGDERQARSTLADAPDEPPANPVRLSTRNIFDGLSVATLNPRLIETYDLPLDAGGVVVVGVEGYARSTGLQPGDILSAIGNRAIRDSADFARAAGGGPANWDITLRRGNRALRLRLRG